MTKKKRRKKKLNEICTSFSLFRVFVLLLFFPVNKTCTKQSKMNPNWLNNKFLLYTYLFFTSGISKLRFFNIYLNEENLKGKTHITEKRMKRNSIERSKSKRKRERIFDLFHFVHNLFARSFRVIIFDLAVLFNVNSHAISTTHKSLISCVRHVQRHSLTHASRIHIHIEQLLWFFFSR